jgi:phytoene synthase
MINKTFYSIFQQGSRTYFYSSLFFPTSVKKDVFELYGFVRKADNYVDKLPQNSVDFFKFKNKYYHAVDGNRTGDIVIDSFVDLQNKKQFQQEWVDAFLHSMEMDITKKTYETIDETLEYIYGSAEVIGLMMAAILSLPQESHPYAKYLGRSMQYINFIRDIAEDNTLHRIYLPTAELNEFGLETLQYSYIQNHPEQYSHFIRHQIERYCRWQELAEQGYRFIPKRFLISVKTAAEMYHWTAEQIYKNPLVVYQWKVKPLISQIITTTLINLIDPNNTKRTKSRSCSIQPLANPQR